MATGPHLEYLQYSEPGFRRYAALHGYDIEIRREALCTCRPASWGKLVLVRDLLRQYDTVVWIDADACFVDFSRDIADACDTTVPLSLVEHTYDDQRVPNTGVFVIRASKAAERLIELMWNDRRYIDHNWWENAALIDLLGYRIGPTGPARLSPYSSLVEFLPNDWNSIEQDPSDRPAIRHYAGQAHEVRLARLADATAPPV